jgi:hypothetical protein
LFVGYLSAKLSKLVSTKCFETAFGPLGPKDISWKKRSHSADLAPVHTPRTTQQLLAEFWTLADWPPYLPDLNLLDFSILHNFEGERPGNNSRQFECPMSVHCQGMGLASERIHPQKLLLIPPLLRKMKFELNRLLANSHTPPNIFQA